MGPRPHPCGCGASGRPGPGREGPRGRTAPQEESNHLRSLKEIKGYRIHARDGEIGHVDDFILDDDTWALRHVVVDTGNWLPEVKRCCFP